MLVRLTSSTAGEMIMFAQHLRALFEIMGKECTSRGVFTKEQILEALVRLQREVDEEKLAAKLAKMPTKDEDFADEPVVHCDHNALARETVSLMQRAQPLIHFMQLTQRENGFILWEAEKNF